MSDKKLFDPLLVPDSPSVDSLERESESLLSSSSDIELSLRKRVSPTKKSNGFMETKITPNSKRRIVLIRHAEKLSYIPRRLDQKAREKDWKNVSGPFNGPLSTLGLQQSIETGERLKEICGIDSNSNLLYPLIISSPFLRCVQTSYQIALQFKRNNTLPSIYLENGLFESMKRYKKGGLPKVGSSEELKEFFPNVEIKSQSVISLEEIFGGEQPDGIAQRFSRTVQAWINRVPSDQHLIFVSHCTPILYTTMKFLKDPIETNRRRSYFAAITSLQFTPSSVVEKELKEEPMKDDSKVEQGKWQVEMEGSTDHLTRYASYCACCKGCLHLACLERKRIRKTFCTIL